MGVCPNVVVNIKLIILSGHDNLMSDLFGGKNDNKRYEWKDFCKASMENC